MRRSPPPKFHLTLILGLLGILLLGGACGGDDDGEPVATVEPIARSPETAIIIPAGEPIIVGVSTALTGGPVGERGEEYRDAVIASVERWGNQIAGHEIEIQAEDDGCTAPGVASIAAERLLSKPGLVGVIGPQCSGGVVAVVEDYAEAGIVMISGSATTTTLTEQQPEGGFFFRTAYRNDLEGTLIGLFAALNQDIGIEKAVIVDNSETYGIDLAENSARISEEFGLTVDRVSIVEGTVDFGPAVAEILSADPDFVGFAGFNPEAALLYRQLRDAGYDGLFGAGDGAASVTGFVEPVGAAEAEGVLFAGCTFPLTAEFLDEFVSLHGHEPQAAFPAQYADAATVLLNAVREVAEPQDDGSLVIQPRELRDAVRATVFDGVSGSIAFDENGDRLPPGVANLQEFVATALANEDTSGYEDLGLVPCQVQGGRLVNLLGPNAGVVQFPDSE